MRPENKFYIVDIGSVYGTYIRVKPTLPNYIEKGNNYKKIKNLIQDKYI